MLDLGHAIVSILLYILGWILVWRERRDVILDHQGLAFLLGSVFFVLTLISDLTAIIPMSVFCAIVWPVCALFVLEKYAINPYVNYIENLLQQTDNDINEDQRLRNNRQRGIFPNATFRTMMIHRRDLLREIRLAYENFQN